MADLVADLVADLGEDLGEDLGVDLLKNEDFCFGYTQSSISIPTVLCTTVSGISFNLLRRVVFPLLSLPMKNSLMVR